MKVAGDNSCGSSSDAWSTVLVSESMLNQVW